MLLLNYGTRRSDNFNSPKREVFEKFLPHVWPRFYSSLNVHFVVSRAVCPFVGPQELCDISQAKQSRAVDVVPAPLTFSNIPHYSHHQKEHNLPAVAVPPTKWRKGPEVSSLEREAPLATPEFQPRTNEQLLSSTPPYSLIPCIPSSLSDYHSSQLEDKDLCSHEACVLGRGELSEPTVIRFDISICTDWLQTARGR